MDEFVRRSKRPRIDLGDAHTPRPARRVPPQTSPVLTKKEADEILPPPPAEILPDNPAQPPKPPRKFWRPKIWLPKSKKQWIIFSVIAALVLGGSGFALYWFVLKQDPKPVAQIQPEPEPEPEPEPTTEPSKLTGQQVAFEVNDRTVYAVQIENSPEARPQAGLAQADIVFEAVAEGGITRFNALFHDQQPESIGPVRSLRPYYIDWFWPFDAAIVHAGGSPEALSDIKSLGLKDLDHGVNGGSFTRVSNRYAPHNLYTSAARILELIGKKGYTSPATTSLERIEPEEETDEAEEPAPATETPAPTLPAASTVNLAISSALYNVVFTYDKASGTYLRAQAGSPHKDEKTGKQIAPHVVIVPVLTKGIHADRVHTQYGTTGSGKVFVFQNGTVTEGTWTKTARNAQWKLQDTAGTAIKLVPGQTWFTIIDKAASVSYTP